MLLFFLAKMQDYMLIYNNEIPPPPPTIKRNQKQNKLNLK